MPTTSPSQYGLALQNPVSIDWNELRSSRKRDPEVLFCAARIDNRQELVSRLGVDSYSSDADLILHAYRQKGTACADMIFGDFAFLVYDFSANRIFAARDIMGCQPVYYSVLPNRLVIGETIEQLLQMPGVSEAPAEDFIAASLYGAFAHHEHTFFKHIKKIPAGHYLVANEKSLHVNPYWVPEQIAQRELWNHNELLEEIRELIRLSIRDRLPVSGRTGIHVSGGLDCSSIAILGAEELKRQNQEPPFALTWYPPPNPDNTKFEKSEYDRIESVCTRAGIDPIYTIQTTENIRDVLNRDHMVRPICNATYNEWVVQKEAMDRGVTTILSGFGGDEGISFDGRGYFQRLALSGKWYELSKFARSRKRNPVRFCASQLFHGLSDLLLSDAALIDLKNRLGIDMTVFRALIEILILRKDINVQNLSLHQQTQFAQTASYINKTFVNRVKRLDPIPPVRYTNDKVARCELLRWSPNVARIESWAADGALHNIRYAYPLLDRRIIEFSLSLPGEVFVNQSWKRFFFRQAMEPILPHNVCWETSKSDPARANPLINCMKQTYKSVGRNLRQNGTGSPKAQYLDMPRLIRDLDCEKVEARSRLGRLIIAMEFLGTQDLR
ncbi:MAG: hypothetical protein KTR18_04020 [Acidiferrobacterales bacterium]|nr:hypothetical protein [Acidiferrobacterales bacterium]